MAVSSISAAPAQPWAQSTARRLQSAMGLHRSQTGDQLQISGAGAAAADALAQPHEAAVSIEALRERHQRNIGEFRAQFQKLLSGKGISETGNLQLKLAPDGSVIVTGDHPQKAEIEKLFAENPELTANLRKLATDAGALQQAEVAAAAANGDAPKPPLDLASVRNQLASFTLAISGENYNVSFK